MDFLVDSSATFLVDLTMRLCIFPISTKINSNEFTTKLFFNAFCLSISKSISLQFRPCSSSSIANLYLGKYASILYPKTLCCNIIFSVANTAIIFDNIDRS